MRIVHKISLIILSIATLTLTSAPVLALNPHAAAQAEAATVSQADTPTTDSTQTTGTSQAANHRAEAQTKLANAKLKSCQNREKTINNIMSHIASRGQKQVDLFTTLATRTETFYATKGKTLSNYDALVADVNAKHTAAQTTVDTVKSSSVTFKCDGTDPNGAAQSFKTNLKAEITALKAYRTSVRNLIVGVKSVQSTTEGSNQ